MSKINDVLTAVYRKDYSKLDKLLESIDPNEADAEGRTALMHAVLENDADPKMVKYLLDHGADPDVHDTGQKWTALHFAARDQKKDIVNVLLDSGASVDSIDAFGNTPLWRCVMNNSPNLDIVKSLLEHGADPYLKNKRGSAPIDVVRNIGHPQMLSIFKQG